MQVQLRAELVPESRTCLGQKSTWFSTDLSPLREAFRKGYPGTPVAILLKLDGFAGSLGLLQD